MEISFRLAETLKEKEGVIRLLSNQPEEYPFFGDWVERTREELRSDCKHALIAFYERILVATQIFQSHKDLPNLLCEIKSARTLGDFERGNYQLFMFRQAEIWARQQGFEAMICDTHADNIAVNNLLLRSGYRELARKALYENNTEEVIYTKSLRNVEDGFFKQVMKIF